VRRGGEEASELLSIKKFKSCSLSLLLAPPPAHSLSPSLFLNPIPINAHLDEDMGEFEAIGKEKNLTVRQSKVKNED
jgi:hypothetical protein